MTSKIIKKQRTKILWKSKKTEWNKLVLQMG